MLRQTRPPEKSHIKIILLRKTLTLFRLSTPFIFHLTLLSALLDPGSATVKGKGNVHASELRCEYLVDPDGIDERAPRLSWRIVSDKSDFKGLRQSAYRIIASKSRQNILNHKGDLWDTGKVPTPLTSQIRYEGEPPGISEKCWWSVMVWDQNGKAGKWSDPACWSRGPEAWEAEWIGEVPDTALRNYLRFVADHNGDPDFDLARWQNPPTSPSPRLRKEFTVGKDVKEAYLYATAIGTYNIKINGERPDSRILAPEISNYDRLLQYQTYDLSRLLKKGENVIGVTLADGWALGRNAGVKWMRRFPHRGFYAPDRRFLARLIIKYEDGSSDIITTDGSWRINSEGSPVREADNFAGETIDARFDSGDWLLPGFDDSSWKPVFTDHEIRARRLVAQKNEPVIVTATYKPQKIWRHNGRIIVDFGRNIAGHCRLKWKGEPGKCISIRHGEWIDDDGSVYTRSLGYAKAIDRFILSGGNDCFEPEFTYHGFQFVEIDGLDGELQPDDIEALSISSGVSATGDFECSNPLLNQLFLNIVQTQRNNMISVLHDNPSRDERTGAAGDIQIFAQTAIFNADMATFLTKYMEDFTHLAVNGQFFSMIPSLSREGLWDGWIGAPGWSEAGLIIPWRLYENYGDTAVISRMYPYMKSHVEAILRENPDLIWRVRHNHNGDWLNANTISNPPDTTYSTTKGATPDDLFATAFFAEAARLLSESAGVIGLKEDSVIYNALAGRIKQCFHDSFLHPDGTIDGNSQGAYSIALSFGLVPDSLESKAYSHLLDCIKDYDGRLSTGFITTPLMMQLLSDHGDHETAYSLLESTRFPSWLYNVVNGATTVWERWDSWIPERGFQNNTMNSLDHVAFGAVAEWMYRHILGINPDPAHPGFSEFILKPQPGGSLTWARGSYDSIHGKIESEWRITAEGTTEYSVTVPPNTTARLFLTAESPEKTISNGIRFEKYGDDAITATLEPGKYSITVKK